MLFRIPADLHTSLRATGMYTLAIAQRHREHRHGAVVQHAHPVLLQALGVDEGLRCREPVLRAEGLDHRLVVYDLRFDHIRIPS